MAKMDDIMEVLTQEISGFNTSIRKLEELSTKFKNMEVKTDTSCSKYRLDDFIEAQKRTMESYENRIESVVKNIEKSRWTPKWEAVMLYAVLCLNTAAFGYLGYYFIHYENKKQTAVLKGREEGMGRARAYFEDHPIIKEDFQKWSVKQDSVPNRE